MCGNPTPFHWEKSIEKILRKDKYWHNQLREAIWWIHGPQIVQYTVTHSF